MCLFNTKNSEIFDLTTVFQQFLHIKQAYEYTNKENNKYNKYNAIQRTITAEQQLYLLYLLSSFYRCVAVT
jgi:hypothetical protein